MGFRFRKSFTLAPGIRMGLGSGGASFSFGPRGSSVSVGSRGVFGNVGIPGTGLSYRQKLSGGGGAGAAVRQAAPSSQTVSMSVSVGVHDDGGMFFKDEAGLPLAEHLVKIAKKQHGPLIAKLIQDKCDEINAKMEAVGELHLGTPHPSNRPTFRMVPFDTQQPRCPPPKELGWFWSLFKTKRDQLEAENRKILNEHKAAVSHWDHARVAHLREQDQQKKLVEDLIYRDVTAMEAHLEATLQRIDWPRETKVATEIAMAGRVIFVDVDLPEIEDMPCKTAAVPKRGMKLSVKDMTETQVKRLYMRHVHGIAFRVIGEAFAALPLAEQVVVSGFSQRRDKATGQMTDEYLYSVSSRRSDWQAIDFTPASLASIDVVEALDAFDLRRTMTKTGIFKPIVPHCAS